MKNKNKILITTICLFICLLILCICLILCLMLKKTQEEQNNTQNNANVTVSTTTENLKTIEEIAKKYNSEYIETKFRNYYYIHFSKDLYDKNGNTNEPFFKAFVNDVIKIQEKDGSFFIIDDEKNIRIEVTYSEEDGYKIKYNNKENFFEETDGKTYSLIENVNIVKSSEVQIIPAIIRDLINENMYFKGIKNIIGDGIELENGYKSFKDGTVLIKMSDGRVKKMIFTKDYDGEIIRGVRVGTDFETIKEKWSNPSKENKEEGYLLYRTSKVYIFFYNDEISICDYNYFPNEFFEERLDLYLKNNNFNSFVENVLDYWGNYEKNECDYDTQTAYITYPSRGIEIKIENNVPDITLYNNYYFSDLTKELVKQGKINANTEEDLLELSEIERRENSLLEEGN